ncbi:MAG: ribonuclease Z [Muribaculaceae bacterium]
MAKFQINILGCGSATTTLQHNPSCQVLNIRDNLFMIDCGEGSQVQMRKMQLKFTRLNHIFISHLHGDHCFGLPGLISTMGLLGKSGTVVIHIFKDGAEQFGNLFSYFCREMPFKIEFDIITMTKKVIYEDDGITVTTIPLKHRVPTVGFLFEEKAKQRHINGEMVKFHNIPKCRMPSLRAGEDYTTENGVIIPNSVLTTASDPVVKYAYCSDTAPAKKIIPCIEGVDWLYHEATFAKDSASRAKQTGHSTTHQAAIVAKEAGVKNLILGHFSSRYNDNQILLREAQEIFPSTILANEGLKLDIL